MVEKEKTCPKCGGQMKKTKEYDHQKGGYCKVHSNGINRMVIKKEVSYKCTECGHESN